MYENTITFSAFCVVSLFLVLLLPYERDRRYIFYFIHHYRPLDETRLTRSNSL